MSASGRPILITGSHRSGSTWVGRMLSEAPGTLLVYEPFHPEHRPGTCAMKPASFYEYVSESAEREGPWRRALEHTVAPRYDLAAELRAPRSSGDNLRMVRDWARYAAARWRGHRVLLKDPLAFFSAPWIARRFDAQVLVVTRHPAAFASSLLRLDWRFEFGAWLDQPARFLQ